MMRCWS